MRIRAVRANTGPSATTPSTRLGSLSIARQTYITFATLLLVWTLAWTLKVYVLDSHVAWLTTRLGGFAFWSATKFLVWILPALWLIRVSARLVLHGPFG